MNQYLHSATFQVLRQASIRVLRELQYKVEGRKVALILITQWCIGRKISGQKRIVDRPDVVREAAGNCQAGDVGISNQFDVAIRPSVSKGSQCRKGYDEIANCSPAHYQDAGRTVHDQPAIYAVASSRPVSRA